MKTLYNDPVLKLRRKELRKKQSRAESFLWRHLRYKRIQGVKFYRQYSLGPYIIDIYCPKWRLAIELDGGQHGESDQKTCDEERTAFLNNENIKVIRFWNDRVLNDPESVVEEIINPSNHSSSAFDSSVADSSSYIKRRPN